MFSNKVINKIVQTLLENGITTEIMLYEDDIVLNLNTGMKSWAYLEITDECVAKVHRRYDIEELYLREDDFESVLDDLCLIVKDCLCNRDYMNSGWGQLLISRGWLTKNVKTTVTYS